MKPTKTFALLGLFSLLTAGAAGCSDSEADVRQGYETYWDEAGKAASYAELAPWLSDELKAMGEDPKQQRMLMMMAKPHPESTYEILATYQQDGHGAVVVRFGTEKQAPSAPIVIEMERENDRWLLGKARMPAEVTPALWDASALSPERYRVSGTVTHEGRTFEIEGGLAFYNAEDGDLDALLFAEAPNQGQIRAQRFGYTIPRGTTSLLVSFHNRDLDYVPGAGAVNNVCLNFNGLEPNTLYSSCRIGPESGISVGLPQDGKLTGRLEGQAADMSWALSFDTPVLEVRRFAAPAN